MNIRFDRNRTSTIVVMYSLIILSWSQLRNTSKALIIFKEIKEVMFLYGIGFKGLVHCRYTKGKEYLLHNR